MMIGTLLDLFFHLCFFIVFTVLIKTTKIYNKLFELHYSTVLYRLIDPYSTVRSSTKLCLTGQLKLL